MVTQPQDGVRITAQSQARSRRKTRKVVLIGSTKSGKTVLLKRYLDHTYLEEYTPTVEDCYNRDFIYKGFDLNLDFIDMCGPTMFPAMLALNVKSADVVMLTYEIDNEPSMKEAAMTYENIQEISTNTNVVLIGTKLDLHPSYKDASEYELSPLFTKCFQSLEVKHLLTSAKTNVCVQDVFELGLDVMVARITAMSLSSRKEQNGYNSNKACCTVL